MAASNLVFSYIDLKGKHCAANQKVTLTYRIADTTGGKALVRERQCNNGAKLMETMAKSDSASLKFWYMNSNRYATNNAAEVKMIQYDYFIYTRTKKAHFNRTRLGRVQVWLGAT